jgi:hypothetical protein
MDRTVGDITKVANFGLTLWDVDSLTTVSQLTNLLSDLE